MRAQLGRHRSGNERVRSVDKQSEDHEETDMTRVTLFSMVPVQRARDPVRLVRK